MLVQRSLSFFLIQSAGLNEKKKIASVYEALELLVYHVLYSKHASGDKLIVCIVNSQLKFHVDGVIANCMCSTVATVHQNRGTFLGCKGEEGLAPL